jgi:hypothetical protein
MRAVVVLVMVSCGRVGFEPVADGGGATASTPDGPARTYREVVMADGPSGYWRLGDTGALAADETGTTAGTFVGNCQHGAPSALTGDTNRAVGFDGLSCNVMLGNTYSFPGRAPYTLELWYTPANLTEYESLIVKETRLGAMPDDGFMLFNARGVVYTERSQSAMNVRTDDVPVALGTTYYFVATYDGSQLSFYQDGVLAVPPVPDTASLPSYAAPAVIGAASDGSQMYASGVLDEVAIYPRALTAQQVAMHYSIGKNGPH